MNVPCTWSRGSVRFFSAGMYFNTTVSSPLYCIVESILLSSYTNINHIIHHCFYCITQKKKTTCVTTCSILVPTLGCRAYQSSIWESNSQESKVSSTSPRKLLCPNRSWCHTETCRVRVSSCEWLITYYTPQAKHELKDQCFELGNLSSQNNLCKPLTLRVSLKTGLMVLALMLVFLLLCRDISGSR